MSEPATGSNIGCHCQVNSGLGHYFKHMAFENSENNSVDAAWAFEMNVHAREAALP